MENTKSGKGTPARLVHRRGKPKPVQLELEGEKILRALEEMSNRFVLVCGDRNWHNREPIKRELSRLPPGTIIVEGGAWGADTVARGVALELGFDVITVWANWRKHGRSAGPIRNRKMLNMKPRLVIAFHHDLSKSKGTADTVQEARKRGIKVIVIRK